MDYNKKIYWLVGILWCLVFVYGNYLAYAPSAWSQGPKTQNLDSKRNLSTTDKSVGDHLSSLHYKGGWTSAE
jgi:hypothetical protein